MYYNEKTAARIMNALLSSAPDSRPALKCAWFDSENRQCACDGFRAYRLNVPVAGVPDVDASKTIDLDKIFPPLDDFIPLELPTLADVRAMIDEDRRAERRGQDKKALYLFTFGTAEDGRTLPAVDLKYLSDLLQLFPDARAYCKSSTAPIVFQDENGDALLLPVRVLNENGVDPSRRRMPPAPVVKDDTPAVGLRMFAALYA